MSLLQVRGLTVDFSNRDGTNRAVDNVSFDLEVGEVLGIVGESGSGKSVSCYSLLGLLKAPPAKVVSGEALFQGLDLLSLSNSGLRKVRGNRVAMVFQDSMASLNPYMKIGDQLTEVLLEHQAITKKDAFARVVDALEEVEIHDAKNKFYAYPFEFSGGMRQRVMIAMALLNKPDLLIADEPTTALDVTVQDQILKLINKLQILHSMAVIFISHDLAVIARVADTVLVMRDGRVVESGPTRDVLKSPKHEYTRILLDAIPKGCKPKVGVNCQNDILEVKDLTAEFTTKRSTLFSSAVSFRAVDCVSLCVKRGEVLGLVGESGSGKSTLGRCIMRLLKPSSGEIWLDGVDLLSLEGEKLRSIRPKFQMIFQDTYASLNPRLTVFDTLVESLRQNSNLNKEQLLQRVNELMDEVGLDRRMIRKYPHEFSGGQRQRIAIARALAIEPKLIIADEPVSALDVTVQAQILNLLLALTKKYQMSMIFISHDLGVVRFISDRIAVMHQGRLVEQGDTESVFNRPQHDYTSALLKSIPVI